MSSLVDTTLLLVQLDEQGIDVMHSPRLGGWVWFDRAKLKAALDKPLIMRSGLVFGPFPSAVAAGHIGGREVSVKRTYTPRTIASEEVVQ